MLNMLIALRSWATSWSGHTINIHCDNEAVVSVLKTGKTRDSHLATFSRNIFMVCAEFDVFIFVEHIPGKNNDKADLLSRWSDSKSDGQKLQALLPSYTWSQITDQFVKLDCEI